MSALNKLLELIREYEGGPGAKGYGTVYGGSPVKADVSRMTLQEVLDFQSRMLKAKSKSSAAGGYQFLQKTLKSTISQMKLSGREVWTPALQDKMAVHLMNGRGYQKYLAGTLSAEDFANNLAKEWASLPVVKAINGKKIGQSYYAGDGLNKSHHNPKTVLAAVKALKADPTVPQEPEPVKPADPVSAEEKKGLLAFLIKLLSLIFSKGK